MWDLIVSVPDRCLSFYLDAVILNKMITLLTLLNRIS